MKWIIGILAVVLGLVALAVGGLYATGNGIVVGFVWGLLFGAPGAPFDPADAVAPPDYADEANWAALPQREDLADLTPAGIDLDHAPGTAPVDVFFIHPTGYLKGDAWTYSMDPATSSEENTLWMMANQASAYNGCCNVHAPRYRQASIYTYFQDEAETNRILDFAYEDVERAFDHFIEHYNDGRPFIVASHSQGTHHGIRLLQRRLEGSPEAERLVAAYLIGGRIERSALDGLADVTLCDAPDDLACMVHWDTYSEAGIEDGVDGTAGNVCTNPLTWRLDGARAPRSEHRGAVPSSGEFHLAITGSDAARNVDFGPLGEPLPGFLEAECRGGILWVTDQSDNAFGQRGGFGGANYHGLDYPLFHMDIRENARLRAARWLAAAAASAAPDALTEPAADAAATP